MIINISSTTTTTTTTTVRYSDGRYFGVWYSDVLSSVEHRVKCSIFWLKFNFLFSESKASSSAKPWQANMKTLTKQKHLAGEPLAGEPLAAEPSSLNDEVKEGGKTETQFDLKRKVDEPPPPKEVASKTGKVRIQEPKVVDLTQEVVDQAQEVGEETPKPEADDRPWRKNMKKPEDHVPGKNNHNFNLGS